MDVRYETPCGIFEWDNTKNAQNIRKHGMDFADAVTVFQDEAALLVYDAAHSEDEDRYRLTGRLVENLVAVVAHTERGGRIRIISARLATKQEKRAYEQHAQQH